MKRRMHLHALDPAVHVEIFSFTNIRSQNCVACFHRIVVIGAIAGEFPHLRERGMLMKRSSSQREFGSGRLRRQRAIGEAHLAGADHFISCSIRAEDRPPTPARCALINEAHIAPESSERSRRRSPSGKKSFPTATLSSLHSRTAGAPLGAPALAPGRSEADGRGVRATCRRDQRDRLEPFRVKIAEAAHRSVASAASSMPRRWTPTRS